MSISSPAALAAVASAFCAFALHLAFPRTGAWWVIPFALALVFRIWAGLPPWSAALNGYLSGLVVFHALVLVVRRNGGRAGRTAGLRDRPGPGARGSAGLRVRRARRVAGRAPLRALARAAGDGGRVHRRRMDALVGYRRRPVRTTRAAARRQPAAADRRVRRGVRPHVRHRGRRGVPRRRCDGAAFAPARCECDRRSGRAERRRVVGVASARARGPHHPRRGASRQHPAIDQGHRCGASAGRTALRGDDARRRGATSGVRGVAGDRHPHRHDARHRRARRVRRASETRRHPDLRRHDRERRTRTALQRLADLRSQRQRRVDGREAATRAVRGVFAGAGVAARDPGRQRDRQFHPRARSADRSAHARGRADLLGIGLRRHRARSRARGRVALRRSHRRRVVRNDRRSRAARASDDAARGRDRPLDRARRIDGHQRDRRTRRRLARPHRSRDASDDRRRDRRAGRDVLHARRTAGDRPRRARVRMLALVPWPRRA